MRRSLAVLATSLSLLAVVGSGSGAAGADPQGGHRSAIPAGFRAQSITWLSTTQGWMLGAASCGEHSCTTVDGTVDGGATWNTLATIHAPLRVESAFGVTEVRFADALHGWVFGPALWATSDGGSTWTKQAPPGGPQLLALAANAEGVYAVVSPCRVGQICGQPVTLWRTMAGQGSWSPVTLTLPAATCCVVLAEHGLVAYLAIPAPMIIRGAAASPDVLDVTVDGQQWSARPDPCHPENGETLTSIAPITDTKVALLCQGNIGFGQAAKRVLRSNDTGQTTSSAGSTPLDGIVSQLASTPSGTLVLSSWGAPGSWIYRNGGGRTWTTPVSLADQGVGWNDIVFLTNQIGFVVYGPAGVFPYDRIGQLWETQDGGLTWAPV